MTDLELLELAFFYTVGGLEFEEAGLIEFARAVAAREREQCARVCDRFAERQMHPAECAAAIRARRTT